LTSRAACGIVGVGGFPVSDSSATDSGSANDNKTNILLSSAEQGAFFFGLIERNKIKILLR